MTRPPTLIARARRRVRRLLTDRYPVEALVRSRALQAALGFRRRGAHVCEILDGLNLEYAPTTDIGRRLFRDGRFEAREIAFVNEILDAAPPAATVIDVGANIGLHSLAWASHRPDLRFVAFEPSPRTAATLARNVRANGRAGQIELRPEAISDACGTAVLHECADDAYSSLKDTARKQVVAQVEVPTLTLDRFVEDRDLDRIALVKVDVEGFETQVLRGAGRLLDTRGPDLFVEIYGGQNSNPDPDATIALARSHGYHAFVVVDGSPVPFQRHDDAHYNYFFTRRDRWRP